MEMHVNQRTPTVATVRRLIGDQFPGWGDLQVRRIAGSGTVNSIFGLGPDLSARFPLVGDDPGPMRQALEAEAAAARELQGRTRFATPQPLAIGHPGPGYDAPWSIQTWLAGTSPAGVRNGRAIALAHDFVDLVTDLRAIPARGRIFHGDGRGGDLQRHDGWMATCFDRSAGLLETGRLRDFWRRARELPRGPSPDVMSHGDLIPANLLLAHGHLTGVIDVGGFGPADPALDLVGAWHLFDREDRDLIRAELGATDLEWLRGRAWAFEQAAGLVFYYAASNPPMSLLGRTTLGRILSDDQDH